MNATNIFTVCVSILLFYGCSTPLVPASVKNSGYSYYQAQITIVNGDESSRAQLANAECKKIYYAFVPKLGSSYSVYNPEIKEIEPTDTYQCVLAQQQSVSALELKQIQSRILRSSEEEIFKALRTFFRDGGGDCAAFGQHVLISNSSPVFSNQPDEVNCAYSNLWNAKIVYQQHDKGILTRARIYIQNQQITSSIDYQTLFKKIADQLFIEAIELDVAEMR